MCDGVIVINLLQSSEYAATATSAAAAANGCDSEQQSSRTSIGFSYLLYVDDPAWDSTSQKAREKKEEEEKSQDGNATLLTRECLLLRELSSKFQS